MKNDIISPTDEAPAPAPPVIRIFGSKTCFFCGDPAPDMVCPECEAKNRKEEEAIEAAKAAGKLENRRRAWREKVGGYQDTEMARLPDTAARRAAAGYIIGSGAGLTICGPGDTGKTRSVVWVATKEVEAGRWVEFRQCGELRQEVSQHAKNGEWGKGVGPLMRCDVLILDDFGNHEFTRTMEEFFLAVLERRTNNGKRTFVTTQYTTAQLRKLFSTEQMADAILRRIGRGYATIVNTLDNTITLWK